MTKLLLQTISKNFEIPFSHINWQGFDLASFSKEKQLFDFQQEALNNALKVLWKYYQDIADFDEKEKLEVNLQRKEKIYQLYKINGLDTDPGYDLKRKEDKKTWKFLKDYYPDENGFISYRNFINRMSFWMATGSGKTLVIVKLIEILKKLIERKEIPAHNILFLTHREDLIEQFKKNVHEFNSSQNDVFINLKSLKDHDNLKRDTSSLFKDNKEIIVFYYRSDLISDEHKEKIIDFRNYDNEGKWYILLDEAHKKDSIFIPFYQEMVFYLTPLQLL